MSTKQNFIEINGKKYDAVTGAMLPHASPTTTVPKPVHHHALPSTQNTVVDGFVKRPKHVQNLPAQRGGSAVAVSTVQRSKTLMRAAVKKPLPVQATKKASPTHPATAAKPVFGKATITPRVASVSPYREQHAAEVKKSSLVHKFGAPASTPLYSVAKKIAPLEVRPAPALAPNVQHTAVPTHHSKTTDLLEKALEAAQGHKEPYHEYKKPLHKRIGKRIGVSSKVATISTAVIAGLLLGGFYAYQNVPNLAMRVAATRAGFKATMPGYSPSGFAFKGPVQYGAGQVVVSFKSNSDDRAYKLTQQTSNWSSDSLLNNYVAVSGKEYQTYQDRGRTIYIYDGSNATWVNGGVWYQVEGKSQLSSDQLVRIADSL